MVFNPGNKRAQNARSGRNASVANGVTTLPNGKGGTVTVTNGSVINYGGTMKFGLSPTVGVSLGLLLNLQNCCPAGTGLMCYNTIQPAGNCNINGLLN